ncbi:MAG TPA: sulfite exporter TauE/SafE family protein [Gemmataceae bacterium]|nr:sulfite exporter TauE/SafE family protein [Gemmataceae bacterium]
MNVLEFTALVGIGALAAGFLGALTGLGGGVVIVPLLVLMGVDMKYAIGASLVSVIATSSGAAASYVKEGYSNIRIGMFLEIATTIGALTGAYLANVIPTQTLSIIFGFVLLISGYLSLRTMPREHGTEKPDPLSVRLRLDGAYPIAGGKQSYHVHRVPLGFALMYLAGCISGLLGIGSGAFKVLAMDQAMRIPFKVSTTTSNFMIGVTAAASAGLYLHHGFIDPALTMPVMLGVLIGSLLGAHVLMGVQTRVLRRVFSAVILVLAIQMIYKGITGKL